MTVLTHGLDRTIVIRATRETVFGFFTDNARWAAWWGKGSTIEAKPGGQMRIRYPNGIEASGEVLEVTPPERLVFTFGYATGQPIAPGSSRVTIRLDAHEEGTKLHLRHEFAEASARDEHVQGWRYQLSLFANAVSDELNATAAERIDRWFAAWGMPDERAREQALAALVSPAIQLRDRFSTIDGAADLHPHITAALRFMPGVRIQRRGKVRQCQGTALADWDATSADGQPRGSGTNVFTFGPDGRIRWVVGLWDV